eukprot:TRINITY_DN6928_c0_g1_i2.p1 TRINITY_DN6928_c0_g1~~TRINITY_DN6928_c0_g1_i2.p1  ORF type:complete len:175 (+),score=23.13 TRINITY_DN6928_c0_g1_i2:158-682(+)
MDKKFGDHFGEVFAGAIQKWNLEDNYFLKQVLHDTCADKNNDSLPPYLSPETYDELQRRVRHDNLVTLHRGNFWNFKEQRAQEQDFKKYDIVHTSNISDWMPIPALHDILKDIKAELITKPGAIIMRRLNGDHVLEDICGNFFRTDPKLNKSLKDSDRSFFYSEVVVGWNHEQE